MQILPHNRQLKYISEICDKIQYGYTGKVTELGNYKYLRITDIQNNQVIWETVPSVNLNKEEASKYELHKWDIVFARTWATVWKSYLIKDDCWAWKIFASYLIRIVPDYSYMIPQYIKHFFDSGLYRESIRTDVVGAAQPNFNWKKLWKIQIPLPPLTTQQQIVAKLDEAMESIESAKVSLYTQIEQVDELWKSELNRIFNDNDFQKEPLMKYVDFVWWSQPSKKNFIYEPKEWYVRLIQIRDYKSDKHITYIPEKSTKKFCNKEDIMIWRYGPPIFQILRWLEWAYNVALMKSIPNEEYVDKEYLYWFLQNPTIQGYIIAKSQRAAGQSGVNKTILTSYEIPLPSLSTQKELVKDLIGIQTHCNTLRTSYTSQLAHYDDFKASILDQAFSGKLVA